MKRLEGKVTIITGTSSGIGKVLAEVFAREGATVICTSRKEATGKPVADAICASGGKAVFMACDVAKEDDVKQVVDATVANYGRVDILVNNAGCNFVKSFEECTPSDWDYVINTDLRGTYLFSWYVVKHMLKAGKGSIVNIATVHTAACLPGAAPYDTAKWGMVGLTKSMAVEFASRNIRINALSPGLIDTQIWKDIQSASPDLDKCHAYWRTNIPMGRVGTCDEMAYAALFLASDEAGYITGSNLYADGGMTSQLISMEPYDSKAIEGK
jgi:NAD(P)-dependent dehydrogenase (short-subunit alcohol dehydrogenase family)